MPSSVISKPPVCPALVVKNSEVDLLAAFEAELVLYCEARLPTLI